MPLLAVPNWSFGRNRALMVAFQEILAEHEVTVHYLEGDVDHNRTVSAYSGPAGAVAEATLDLAEAAFAAIDLNHHIGVHPRIGALDVCPFIAVDNDLTTALLTAERVAEELAERFSVPVYLYEKSEHGRHEADLPSLRKGGFGGLMGKVLQPDYGPPMAHQRLGVSVVGVRDFLIAMNVNLETPDPSIAKLIASMIRSMRAQGDPRFLGVRALGFSLASREITQVSLNLSLPDITPVDPIIEWIRGEARSHGVPCRDTELIGVIRARDLAQASRLPIRAAQVVPC